MRASKPKSPWWAWWLKWWIIAAGLVFLVLIFSEPPQLWFWLVLFLALVLYSTERAING
ncbi:hypothetical protein GFS31_43400 (plasmid) [Leptolyngbya sp. BL0902]|uniref:hypothetical protein n=1 Tax=Leptolyngbya sp. BL0902 TaxID=1115757 RepID=UPI0018E821BF|nr:hypothetical protein [Leptolyngbya sp. BL0902]QQE67627.1 hypothetical protein GFS31_43400 [Leptolyngbya sp. BL0902]